MIVQHLHVHLILSVCPTISANQDCLKALDLKQNIELLICEEQLLIAEERLCMNK